MSYQYITPDKIREMLFNESEYVQEFCEAGISSVEEFREQFRLHLLDRNMKDLRRAGHKMKPGAMMMGADRIVEEYENAKKLLKKETDAKNLQQAVKQMDELCTNITRELSALSEQPG